MAEQFEYKQRLEIIKKQQEDAKKKLDALIVDLQKKEAIWCGVVEELAGKIKGELTSNLIDVTAEVTSQKVILGEERSQFYYQIYMLMPIIKVKEQESMEFYSTRCAIKLNGTEKSKMIEAEVSYYKAKVDLMQNYILFCTEMLKNIDNINYAIKNKVDFYNISRLS